MKNKIIKARKERHQQWYWEVEEELCNHEAPYYAACARGTYFSQTKEWKEERDRLTRIYYALSPYSEKTPPRPKTDRVSFCYRLGKVMRKFL